MRPCRSSLVLGAVLWTACSPIVPEGEFDCQQDAQCPPGWVCGADDKCYSSTELAPPPGDTAGGDERNPGDTAAGDDTGADTDRGDLRRTRDGGANGDEAGGGGDSASGDTAAGDTATGDAIVSAGDSAQGDQSAGDTNQGDTRRGDGAPGGDSRNGDPLLGDPLRGDPVIGGDAPVQNGDSNTTPGGDTSVECINDGDCTECEACINSGCQPFGSGQPCGTTRNCQNQVWGSASAGGTTTCYARADVRDQCDGAGACIPASCSAAPQGNALASCDDTCANTAGGICDPGDPAPAVTSDSFCQPQDTVCGFSCDDTIWGPEDLQLVPNGGVGLLETVCWAKAPMANLCDSNGSCVPADCKEAGQGVPLGWCSESCYADPDPCIPDAPLLTLSELCLAGRECTGRYCNSVSVPNDTIAVDVCSLDNVTVGGHTNVDGLWCQQEIKEGCVPYTCTSVPLVACRMNCQIHPDCAFGYTCVNGFCQ